LHKHTFFWFNNFIYVKFTLTEFAGNVQPESSHHPTNRAAKRKNFTEPMPISHSGSKKWSSSGTSLHKLAGMSFAVDDDSEANDDDSEENKEDEVIFLTAGKTVQGSDMSYGRLTSGMQRDNSSTKRNVLTKRQKGDLKDWLDAFRRRWSKYVLAIVLLL